MKMDITAFPYDGYADFDVYVDGRYYFVSLETNGLTESQIEDKVEEDVIEQMRANAPWGQEYD